MNGLAIGDRRKRWPPEEDGQAGLDFPGTIRDIHKITWMGEMVPEEDLRKPFKRLFKLMNLQTGAIYAPTDAPKTIR